MLQRQKNWNKKIVLGENMDSVLTDWHGNSWEQSKNVHEAPEKPSTMIFQPHETAEK